MEFKHIALAVLAVVTALVIWHIVSALITAVLWTLVVIALSVAIGYGIDKLLK